MKTRLVLGVALIGSLIVASPIPADAATSNTPVWIGAGFDGSYRDNSRPGMHGGGGGGGQVAFDYYGPAGRTVRIYAAPKNNDYNDQITAHIIDSYPTSRRVGGQWVRDAKLCGWRVIVEIRRSGNRIGTVSFSHLAAQAAEGKISRWGGVVGKIAELPLNSGASCYAVSNAINRHVHIEFKSYGPRPACAHDWGKQGAKSVPATLYQGYLGDYGKPPLGNAANGYVCPRGI